MAARRVAVVGGGIAGLVAARALAAEHDVTLFEAAPAPGGRLTTARLRDRPFDPGPDAFIRRNRAGTALAAELGLAGELVSPSARGAALYGGRRLTPLPSGLAVGIPTDFRALWASGTVGRWGALRAAADLWLGPLLGRHGAGVRGDPSVGELVGGRLGRAVLDNLVDPLVGGINASDVDSLSFAAALPQLLPLLGRSSSMMRALRPAASPPPAADPPPVFAGLERGLGSLTVALAADVTDRGVRLRCASPVRELAHAVRWQVTTETEEEAFDGLLLALPAPQAAALLRGADEALAAGLSSIPYAGVVTAAFVFSETAVPGALSERLAGLLSAAGGGPALPGAGVLVGRASGTLATAFSFTSTKWPRSARPGEVVIRASAGRHGDRRALELDDGALTAALAGELARILGITAAPLEVLVTRFPDSFPQYVKGHLGRVAALREAAAALPPLALAGAAYDGIGIPACIAGAVRQAEELARALAG
ncbi:MAG TPA: protoporphyrinogen oxidase [Acidimicrobiales bacterium]|nr:protoporphyrinogen oxidase [Acidimicrobiales bacterium]